GVSYVLHGEAQVAGGAQDAVGGGVGLEDLAGLVEGDFGFGGGGGGGRGAGARDGGGRGCGGSAGAAGRSRQEDGDERRRQPPTVYTHLAMLFGPRRVAYPREAWQTSIRLKRSTSSPARFAAFRTCSISTPCASRSRSWRPRLPPPICGTT